MSKKALFGIGVIMGAILVPLVVVFRDPINAFLDEFLDGTEQTRF